MQFCPAIQDVCYALKQSYCSFSFLLVSVYSGIRIGVKGMEDMESKTEIGTVYFCTKTKKVFENGD